MLHQMCGKARPDMIRNENDRMRVGVAPILERKKGGKSAQMVWTCKAQTYRLCSQQSRSNGGWSNHQRQRKTQKTIRTPINYDLGINELDRDMMYDKKLQRCLIHEVDPT